MQFYAKKIESLRIFKNANILKLLVSSIFYDATFITAYANIIINNIANTGVIIAIILAIKKIVRVFFDIPVGILVDKYLNPRISVIIALVIKIIFILLMLFNNIYILFLASILEGISLSFYRGKINILQYEIFEDEGLSECYEFFSSIYGLIINICTVIIAITASIVYMFLGMYAMFAGSALFLLVSLYLLHRLPTTGNAKLGNKPAIPCQSNIMPKYSLLHKIKNALLSTSTSTIGLSVVLGVSCLGWQINAINQFVGIGTLEKQSSSVYIFQMGSVAMSIGYIISMFTYNLKPVFLSFLLFVVFLLSSVISFIVSVKYSVFIVLPCLLAFSSIEVNMRKIILQKIDPKIRSVIISISTTVTSLIGFFIMYAFQILNSKIGYKNTYISIFTGLSIFVFIVMLFIIKYDDTK